MLELNKLTCKDLRDLAKDLDISGRWEMKKDELIEAILRAKNVENDEKEITQNATDEVEIGTKNVEVETKEDKSANTKQLIKTNDTIVDAEQKLKYIENIDVGALVAFRQSDGRVRSAKVDKKSSKRQKLKLVTEYGAEFLVDYSDVVWVRTGKRWPRGVYNMLKGLVASNAKEAIGQ